MADDVKSPEEIVEAEPVKKRNHGKGEYRVGKHPNSIAAAKRNKHTLNDEDRRKGRATASKNRTERATLRRELDQLLKTKLNYETVKQFNGDLVAAMEALEIENAPPMNTMIAFAQILNAIKGDNRAFENVRDTVGEKPVEKAEHSVFSDGINVVISDIED